MIILTLEKKRAFSVCVRVCVCRFNSPFCAKQERRPVKRVKMSYLMSLSIFVERSFKPATHESHTHTISVFNMYEMFVALGSESSARVIHNSRQIDHCHFGASSNA